MRKNYYISLVIVLTAMLFLTGCATSSTAGDTEVNQGEDKLIVYTTIFPLYDFTRNVGGDLVEVINFIPLGQDAHHWEPTPSALANLKNADIFIYNGLGMEAWLDKLLGNYPNILAVDASEGIELISNSHHDDDHQHSHGKDEPVYDPHIWLDPLNAKEQVKTILRVLIERDPENKEYYTANAQNYLNQLDDLHKDYQEALANTTLKKFVVSHAAFEYLARRYGLEQIAIRGVFADSEPGPATMKEIVNITKDSGLKYIFHETMISPKVSEVIAQEAGVDTLCLNPIASVTEDEMNAGASYIGKMRENLSNLSKALD